MIIKLIFIAAMATAESNTTDSSSWYLEATNALFAWQVSQGDPNTLVAIIDTGAELTHPLLKDNIWTNPGESGLDEQGRDRANNEIDDDKNGFVDDIHGWNFVSNNNDVSDEHGHGTHVAGIIKKTAPRVSLMILKYFDAKSSGAANVANTIKAIQYATKMRAQIINYSGGGKEKSPGEELAIQEAQNQKILFVAAAGNEKSNSDERGFYPADYGLSNIASVTAIDEEKTVLPSSNYGVKTVDLAAPGKNISSSLPGGLFGTMTGTSQATAFVTGAAALLLSQNASLRDPEKIILILVNTGFKNENLVGKTKNETQLDIYRTLVMKDRDQDAFGNPTNPPGNEQPEDLPFKKNSNPNKLLSHSASQKILPQELY